MKRMKLFIVLTLVVMPCLQGTPAWGQTIIFDPFTDGDITNGADPLDVEWAPHRGSTLSVIDDNVVGGINSGNAIFVDRNNNAVTGPKADLTGGQYQLASVGDFIKLEFDYRFDDIDFTSNVTNRGLRAGFFTKNGTPEDDNDDQGYYFQTGVGDPTFFPEALEFAVKQEVGGQTNGPANGSDHAVSAAGTGTMLTPIDDTDPRSLAFTLTRTALGVEAKIEMGDGSVVSDEFFVGSHSGEGLPTEDSIDLDTFEYFGIFAAKRPWDLIIDNVEVTTNAPIVEPGFAADFDQDGDVDGADFIVWQRGLGTEFDATDLANWQSEFGSVVSAINAVPEPSTWLLLMSANLFLYTRSRHKAL